MELVFLFILLILIIGVVAFGIVVTLALNFLEVAFRSVFAAGLFAIKYSIPAFILIALVGLLNRKKDWKGSMLVTGFVMLVAEVIFAVGFFSVNVEPDLIPVEDVSRVYFYSRYVDKDSWWDEGEWKTRDVGGTDDTAYLEAVYDAIREGRYKHAVEENVDAGKFGEYYGVLLYDDEDEVIGSVQFFCPDYVAVRQGDKVKYYRRVEDEDTPKLKSDTMLQLAEDLRAAEIHAVWDDFAGELKESITCDGEYAYFTIPEDIPGENYSLTVFAQEAEVWYDGWVDAVTVDLDWEPAQEQSWTPGETYAIPLENRTYCTLRLTLWVSGEEWWMDMTKYLPEGCYLEKSKGPHYT